MGDLANGTEIANRLFVPRSRVSMWANRETAGFPEPVAYGTGVHYRKYAPLWDMDAVEAWFATYRRPPAAKPVKRKRDRVPAKRERQMRKTKQRAVAKKAPAKVDLRAKMMERRFRP
jgi:hypothetical protein